MVKKLALIAGGGNFPPEVIDTLISTHTPFKLFLIKENAQEADYSTHSFEVIDLHHLIKKLRIFKQEGGCHAVFVGTLKRIDEKELEKAFSITLSTLGDDINLRAIKRKIETIAGIKIIPVQKIIPSLTHDRTGPLGDCMPSERDMQDMMRGRKILNSLAKYDIGQAIVIRKNHIIGIEAAEHTDNLLLRCKELRYSEEKAGLLVKLPKIRQIREMDWPTIGMHTVVRVSEAGLNGIALSPGGVLLLQRRKMIEKANQLGIFIYVMKKNLFPFHE